MAIFLKPGNDHVWSEKINYMVLASEVGNGVIAFVTSFKNDSAGLLDARVLKWNSTIAGTCSWNPENYATVKGGMTKSKHKANVFGSIGVTGLFVNSPSYVQSLCEEWQERPGYFISQVGNHGILFDTKESALELLVWAVDRSSRKS